MSVNSKMTAIADKIRSLLGINGKLGLDAMDTNLESANTEVATQEELMEEILTTLAEKSANTGESAKPEQEKTIDITENGTTEVLPDSGKVLSKVTVNVDVQSGGGSGEDNPLQYATFHDGQIFRGAVFPPNYVLDFSIAGNESTSLARAFAYSKNLEKLKITIPRDVDVNMMNMFSGSVNLKEITFVNGIRCKSANQGGVFQDCTVLETISGEVDLSLNSNNGYIFSKCYGLKDVQFKANCLFNSISFIDSNLLSDNSIQSIVDGLATVETAQTITLHADVKAKLTETQLATITGKNWTLA